MVTGRRGEYTNSLSHAHTSVHTTNFSSNLLFYCVSAEHGQQKTFKRKRSLINWPFWRGSSSQLDGLPLSPTTLSHTQGQLFGRPLSFLCSAEHGLPKPIMVSPAEGSYVTRVRTLSEGGVTGRLEVTEGTVGQRKQEPFGQ